MTEDVERKHGGNGSGDDCIYLKLLFTAVLVGGLLLYTFRLTSNPAGFFVDESSIAYNAFTISQTGRDEFGIQWPLFFRAFGDYKNPVYIYLLAGLFQVTGPSILVARLLSAVAGVLAATSLGLLATQLTTRPNSRNRQAWLTGLVITTSALLTPWLFEISRVTLEVAVYPLLVVLFLWSVHRASTRAIWSWFEVACLTTTLALMTYSYSIGRLFAPLLGVGLVIFATRARLPGLLRTWAMYLLTLIPLINYQRVSNGALTARFDLVTYMKPENSLLDNIWQFVRHFLGNLDPRRLVLNGDPNIYQVTHLYGKPVFLVATLSLVLIGIGVLIWQKRTVSWWHFVAYGLLVSLVPASLTVDYFHILRLAALPVFLLLLAVPGVAWLIESDSRWSRILVVVFFLLTVTQGLFFQWQYHSSASSAWRRHLFDADYPEKIFEPALATGATPIYLAETLTTSYIQAYWYATLKQIPLSRFVHLKPGESAPPGGLVIASEDACSGKGTIARIEPYTLYIAEAPSSERVPLPEGAFRAELTVLNSLDTAHVGQRIEMQVLVKNKSDFLWPGCKRGSALLQIYLGSHWLDSSEQGWIREEGRSALPTDLTPNGEARLRFIVQAPLNPGRYALELDMLQEGVTWFGLKGSPTTRVRINVK